MNTEKKITVAAILAMSISLGACNDSDRKKHQDQDTELPPTQTLLDVDASAYDNFVYYNLKSMQKVELSDPESSMDWHIAFRRQHIILNGGDSGAGNVEGALASTNGDFYDGSGNPVVSAFINATAENQSAHFDAATTGSELTEYIADVYVPAIDGSSTGGTHWYSYNFINHTVSANPDNWWYIRSANGNAYAQFHVTGLTQNGMLIDDISFELHVQEALASNGDFFADTATVVNNLDLTSGPACYDIDTQQTMDCSNSDWDLYFDPEIEIYLNSGIKGAGAGAAFGPLAQVDLVFASGADIPNWVSDSSSSIFSEESWYAYNLEGNHKLWSNFNVYAIDTDAGNPDSLKLKAQIHSYYSDTGNSGHFSIRVAPL